MIRTDLKTAIKKIFTTRAKNESKLTHQTRDSMIKQRNINEQFTEYKELNR